MSSTEDYMYNVGFSQGYAGLELASNHPSLRRGYDDGADERDSHMLEYEDLREYEDWNDQFDHILEDEQGECDEGD